MSDRVNARTPGNGHLSLPGRAVDTPSPASQGPYFLTPLVGRDHVLDSLLERLLSNNVRLVTLTGPGGIGKTRLAQEAGSRLRDSFPDGNWFVDLLPVSDPEQVPAAIARALGTREGGGQSILERLTASLRDRRALLILDNFEQVVAAAPLVVEILSACPDLRVLVTSRVSLHVSGEHHFPVPALEYPATGPLLSMPEIANTDAVRLFMMRAIATNPDFQLVEANMATVAAICQRLDGLPLAIELAAARVKYLSPSAMLARMDRQLELLTGGMRDHPARMQSMRSTIAWSYDLLSPDEQRLFRYVSVFVDGFTLEAAIAISVMDDVTLTFESHLQESGPAQLLSITPSAVLDGVGSLIDKSLVEQARSSDAGSRFTLLETLREFGLEQLAAHDELRAVRNRHAAWCLALAEETEAERIGLVAATDLDRHGPERENMRAALLWLREQGEVRAGLRLASALWPLWLERGEVSEGRAQLTAMLALPAPPEARVDWACAMCVTGALAQAQGDHELAVDMSQLALEVFEETGDDRGAAVALNTLGLDEMIQGDTAAAASHLQDSLERFQRVDDPRAGTWAMRHLSSVAFRAGDVVKAAELASEGLAIARVTGNHLDIARLLLNLALAATIQGNLDEAWSLNTEALDLFQQTGDRWGVADARLRLGQVAFERGDASQAEEFLKSGLGLLQEIGDPEGQVVVLALLGWVYRAQGAVEMATNCVDKGLTIARQQHNPSRIGSTMLVSGALAMDQGERSAAAAAWNECLVLASTLGDRITVATALEWAAHLTSPGIAQSGVRVLGAASAIREVQRVPVAASIRAERLQLVDSLRLALGDERYARELANGKGLSPELAMAEAIGIFERAAAGSDGLPRHLPFQTSPAVLAGLTPRETDVLRLLAKGMTDRQIGEALFISHRTTATHMQHIFHKLNFSSRSAAAAHAIRNGLV